jgi:DMSO/TMAO reductase YedYZ molybdopterin-dependent catalytic subunit
MQPTADDRARPRLPPGQRVRPDFPRFGIVAYARQALPATDVRIEILGAIEQPLVLCATELATLTRVTQRGDFHCAAGWSHLAVEWSGFRFKDVWQQLILPKARPTTPIKLIVLRCQDRYRTSLPLADLLAPDVLLADRLNGQPLTVEHGAPIRLVAPAHYGYKNAKHLRRFELRADEHGYRPQVRLLDHPRARVAEEERGQFLPGWILRYAFRPFIEPIIRAIKATGDPPSSSSASRSR